MYNFAAKKKIHPHGSQYFTITFNYPVHGFDDVYMKHLARFHCYLMT